MLDKMLPFIFQHHGFSPYMGSLDRRHPPTRLDALVEDTYQVLEACFADTACVDVDSDAGPSKKKAWMIPPWGKWCCIEIKGNPFTSYILHIYIYTYKLSTIYVWSTHIPIPTMNPTESTNEATVVFWDNQWPSWNKSAASLCTTQHATLW